MGVAPDFGAKVNGGEDGGSIDPNVVEYVGVEWDDEGKGMGFKVGDAGDVAKEVFFDEFFLWDPEFLTMVVDDGVLVRVTVGNKGAGRSSEDVGEDIG